MIKIAHGALESKMVKALAALPMKAEGGSIESPTKREDHERGVNRSESYGKPGESKMGHHVRAEKADPGEGSMGAAKLSAKKSLSEMRSMPKPKLYAEGTVETPVGEEAAPAQDMDPQSPAPAEAPSDPAQSPDQSQATAAQDPTAGLEPPQKAQLATMDPQSAAYAQTIQEMRKHNNDWAMALHNQAVTPETYRSLFNKQDTLGKIGSIFGLMLGGAGGGLTHQGNSFMQALDKTLDRDLESKKQTAANAQNFLKIAQEYELNRANIRNTMAQAQGYEAAIPGKQAESAMAMIKAEALAKIMHTTSAVHYLSQITQNIPPNSPNAKIAPALLANIASQAKARNEKHMQDAATKSAMVAGAAMRAAPPASDVAVPASAPAVNSGLINKAAQQAQNSQWVGVPTALTPDLVNAATTEASKAESIRNLSQRWAHNFNELMKLPASGPYSNRRKAFVTEIANDMSHKLGLGGDQAQAQAEAMFPTWNDLPAGDQKTRRIKYEQGKAYWQGQESGLSNLNRLKEMPGYEGVYTPPKWPAFAAGEAKKAPKEGDKGTYNGKTVTRKNGHWVLD
jgi:hypothetical protein